MEADWGATMQRRVDPDIINRNVVALPPASTVGDAVRLMAERHIGAVMIIEAENLIGIFTERDVVTRVIARQHDPDTTTLAEVMTTSPQTVGPDDTALEALSRMSQHGFRHLPVVKDSRVIGMISVRDLYAAVTRQLEEDIQAQESLILGTGYGTGG